MVLNDLFACTRKHLPAAGGPPPPRRLAAPHNLRAQVRCCWADEEQRVKPISGAALQRLAIGDPVRAAPPPRRDA